MESEKQYSMFIHLSQLAGSIAPLLGFILPLILWLNKKDQSAFIDANGKIVINWIISYVIYAVISTILAFVGIGIILLIALVICNIVFIVIGCLRANEGVLWPYPLTINFIH